jgi:hypothetical protein
MSKSILLEYNTFLSHEIRIFNALRVCIYKDARKLGYISVHEGILVLT